jgi:hypothetical protein
MDSGAFSTQSFLSYLQPHWLSTSAVDLRRTTRSLRNDRGPFRRHVGGAFFQNITGIACSLFARVFDFAYRMCNPNFVSVEVVL